jgi:hypothetical protein
MRGKDIVIDLQQRERRNAGRFLPDVDMVVPTKTPLIVQFNQRFLKMADQKHLATKLEQIFP